MGTSGIAFQTLTSGNVAAGNAINLNNLDAAGAGTFSGGAVTIGGTAGAGADGINITGSNSTFNFASATIDNTAGDGIEINGTTPNTTGAVTFTTVNLDGMAGQRRQHRRRDQRGEHQRRHDRLDQRSGRRRSQHHRRHRRGHGRGEHHPIVRRQQRRRHFRPQRRRDHLLGRDHGRGRRRRNPAGQQ